MDSWLPPWQTGTFLLTSMMIFFAFCNTAAVTEFADPKLKKPLGPSARYEKENVEVDVFPNGPRPIL